jgi:hypothetical protein
LKQNPATLQFLQNGRISKMSSRFSSGRFSLTPALSRWEREQLLGASGHRVSATSVNDRDGAGSPLSQRERARVREINSVYL